MCSNKQTVIYAVTIGYSVSGKPFTSPPFGNLTGAVAQTPFVVTGKVLGVQGWYQTYVNGLQIMAAGDTSDIYGVAVGVPFMYEVPASCALIGFQGRWTAWIDALGALYGD